VRAVAAAIGLLLCISCRTAAPPEVPVIPAPAEVRSMRGGFTVTAQTAIAANDPRVEWTARYFADLLARTRGLTLPVERTSSAPAIAFALDDRIAADEGYELRVTSRGVSVTARDPRGLLYGAVTLWQLLTVDVHLAAMEIRDAPRFAWRVAWRGLMLDSARHYQSPEFIERFIDTMALHKLNTLQWHLTDDQAWRLEIKKYPRLAEIGGWRAPAGAGRSRKIGGIYTQDDVRRLVAYAAQRGITIVPEIEMPGHASAAIVAYPQLASTDDPPRDVPADWGVYRNLYNVDESTFAFLEDVLTEVLAIFPSPYIHVGGDEAVKDQWRSSPRVQARMRELGIADETTLQSYFIRRIETFLSARGRRLIGWDEILEGGIAPNATVTSWRGVEGAVTAARAGHDAVLSPDPILYLNNRQSALQDSPGRGGVVGLEQVYAFEPLRADLTAEENAHILGVQANLWSEHIRTEERVELMAWPRGAAVAEVGWSPREKRDYRGFLKRLVPQFARYRALGVHAADAKFIDGQRTPDGPRRNSHQLRLCSERLVLSLEDDAPLDGERAVFLTDIMNPCWIYPAVDLTKGATLAAAVGQLPFNFQIGDDVKKIELPPPSTPEGELEVFAGCEGPRIASLPLAPAASNDAVTVLPEVTLPPRGGGPQDLCFRFTRRTVDPIWAVQWIEIRP
jgi:hexosaminidase